MKKIYVFLILVSLCVIYSPSVPAPSDCQVFSNQYGILEVCPMVSHADTNHVQFWNLTPNITADIDIAFVFDNPLISGGLYRLVGQEYVKINHTVVNFNGRTAYVFNNLHVNAYQLYQGKIEFTQKINTSGKWDMYVKLVSDTWANYRIHLDPWWNSTYKYFIECFVDASYIGSDLQNFPVLVRINQSLGALCDNGSSIRFVAGVHSGGTENVTEYPYEIENWNVLGESAVWVKIPSVDGEVDTQFLMYYNNSNAVDNQKRWFVWDTNYVYVQHFSGYNLTGFFDSSSYNNSASALTNTPDFNITGKSGNATYFDSGHIKIPDDPDLDLEDDHTIEFVVQPKQKWSDGSSAFRIYWKSKLGSPYKGTVIQFDSTRLYCYNSITDGYYSISSEIGVPKDVWYYFADLCKENSTASKIYENMTDITSSGISRSTFANIYDLYIGTDSALGYPCNSYFDEVRVSKIARSTDWLKASYNSSFITNFVYFGGTFEYFAPTSNPVNYSDLSFTNNTGCFPLYLNNISINLHDDDIDTFNATFTLSNGLTSTFSDVANGTFWFNFTWTLSALKNYTLWINCTNAGLTFRYWFEFRTCNFTGSSSSSSSNGVVGGGSTVVGLVGIVGLIGVIGYIMRDRKKRSNGFR